MTSDSIDWQIKALSKKAADLSLRMSRNTVNTQKDISAKYALDGKIRKLIKLHEQAKKFEHLSR